MSNHDRDYLELVFLHALQVLPASEIPVLRLISPRVRSADRKWRRFVRSSAPSSPGQPMCCGRQTPCGAALRSESQRRLGKRRYCHRHNHRLNRTGKKPRPASATKCWRRIHRTTASVCSCVSRREPTIRLTAMAGVEELYLLDGELWIDDKKLYPGDYNRAEAGSADQRVWSETGCTCVLLTSTRDVLR